MPFKAHQRIRLALIAALAFGALSCSDSNANADNPEPAGAASTNPTTSTQTPNQGEPVGLTAIDAFIESQDIDKSASNWKTRLPKPPQVEFEEGRAFPRCSSPDRGRFRNNTWLRL